MRTTRWWWGLLCIAGMACSGDGPPLGAVEPVVGGDLEFVLPSVRGETPIFTSFAPVGAQHSVDADTALGTLIGASADLTEGTSKTSTYSGPLIFSKSIASRFKGSRIEMEYGMTGFGTGYSMVPSLDVVTTAGDRIIASAGSGRSEDAPIPWRFKPVVQDFALLHRDCGMLANLLVLFEGRLTSKVMGLTREQQSGRSTAHAPLCPVVSTASGGGGGGEGGTTYTLTICSYEVFYNSWGEVVDIIALGCISYPLGLMT